MTPSRLGAARVFVIYQGAFSIFFYVLVTCGQVYRITEAGLGPLPLVLVGTTLEVTVLLLEIPTGVVADTWGRKRSVLIGLCLFGAGFIVEGSFPSLLPILIGQVLWGAGYTFTSGADVAWIADEIGEEEAARLYVRAAQVAQGTAVIGIAAAIAIGAIDLGLAIVIAGIGFILLAAFLAVVMPEENFDRSAEERAGGAQQMLGTLRGSISVVRARPILVLILIISFIQGAASEGFDRLWHLQVLANTSLPAFDDQPIIWFGLITGAGLLLAIAGTEFVKRKVNLVGHDAATRVLGVLNLALVAAVVAFGLAGNFLMAVSMYLFAILLREVEEPIFTGWLNRGLDPRSRATVNSMSSQSHALGEVAGGPVFGVVAAARSVSTAIVIAGLARLPAIPLFARARRAGAGPVVVETTSEPPPGTPPSDAQP